MKMLPALAASLSVMAGLAVVMPVAEARDGGHFAGGGENFGGADHGRFYGERPNFPDRPRWNRNNVYPWINVDAGSINDMIPENNSGSSQPNDCNYLFKKANETGDSTYWRLFNDCSHGR